MKGLKITAIEPDATALELGLEPGDEILSINATPVCDYLSYCFLIKDEEVTLLVKKKSGGVEDIEVEKDEDDDLGIILAQMRLRRCNNKCVFCFVEQMPAGMRGTLYVKDEDYRHSFLYGNYVTLTTLKDYDYERIIRERLSPLYVSVHTTDDAVRRFLLGNKKAPAIMDCVRRLADGGIIMHTQAVIAPGLNDGERLVKTVEDLAALYPKVASLAVVPVGLTRHREGLYPLAGFNRKSAAGLLDSLEPLRKKYRKEHGISFVYPSDELYIKAGRDFPKAAHYDGYPQLDNGVGLVRDFLTEFGRAKRGLPKSVPKTTLLLVTGVSFAPYLKAVAKVMEEAVAGLKLTVVPVRNELFGHSVTVTGLLCGRDIAAALKGRKADAALVPYIAMREGEGTFLDDMTPVEVEREAGMEVIIVKPTPWKLVDMVKALARKCFP